MTEPGERPSGTPEAGEILRGVVDLVDSGAFEATAEQRAYVAGAMAAMLPADENPDETAPR